MTVRKTIWNPLINNPPFLPSFRQFSLLFRVYCCQVNISPERVGKTKITTDYPSNKLKR